MSNIKNVVILDDKLTIKIEAAGQSIVSCRLFDDCELDLKVTAPAKVEGTVFNSQSSLPGNRFQHDLSTQLERFNKETDKFDDLSVRTEGDMIAITANVVYGNVRDIEVS